VRSHHGSLTGDLEVFAGGYRGSHVVTGHIEASDATLLGVRLSRVTSTAAAAPSFELAPSACAVLTFARTAAGRAKNCAACVFAQATICRDGFWNGASGFRRFLL
jgi:hypothetical protein